MQTLDLAKTDCLLSWGDGDVVLRLDGADWQLGVAKDCSPVALGEAKAFLGRVGIVIDDDDSGHDVDDNFMVWWVLTSDEVCFWKE